MNWKKYGYFFLGIFLCMAGILFGRSSAKAATISENDLKKLVVEAYQSYQTTLDVKQYGLYNDAQGSKLLSNVMQEVMNEMPYLFYTGRSFSKEILEHTKQITRIGLSYSSGYKRGSTVDISKIKSTRKELDAAVKKITAGIPGKLKDVEKAMLLHDYLVQNVSYDDRKGRDSRLTAVGALLEQKANCQGYSVAYKLLLKKAGISVKCISSSQMSHMWNLVKIGSAWYHTDVTWDDPLNSRNQADQYGMVYHDNFLVSTAAIKKTGHYGVPNVKAADTRFDKRYWRKVEGSFWYQPGQFIYGAPDGIYSRSRLNSSAAKCLKKLSVRCLVQRSPKQYYLISGNKIYLFHAGSKKMKMVYQAAAGCSLVQLKYEEGKLMFRYLKGNRMYTAEKAA